MSTAVALLVAVVAYSLAEWKACEVVERIYVLLHPTEPADD